MNLYGSYKDPDHQKDHESIVKAVGLWSDVIAVTVSLAYLNTTPLATALSNLGLGSFSAANLVDGNIGTVGFETNTAVAGSCLKIDQQVRNEKVRLYLSAAGYAGIFRVEYSDDDVSYFPASGSWNPNGAGWNEVVLGVRLQHRYWRLYLENTPGPGPTINELELYTIPDTAVPHLLEYVPSFFMQVFTPLTTGVGILSPGFTAWTKTNIYIRATSDGVYHLIIRR
ncbi:MAG: hypothetical protein PHQ91_12315 [Thermoanaerobaculaceae bacterium]|nr:hypothetical protein [Thermoanaerobaculaceae bacterium]